MCSNYFSTFSDYGWVVVFCCFLLLAIADGLTVAFGVLYSKILERYNTSPSAVAWISAIQNATNSVIGKDLLQTTPIKSNSYSSSKCDTYSVGTIYTKQQTVCLS